MTVSARTRVFCSVGLSFMVLFLDVRTDAALEGASVGYLSRPYAASPGVARVSQVKVSHDSQVVVSRRKRNILFPSGVKLCVQETTQQVKANHLSYFHLRVCQETIWEAFKIFWDRLPEQDEYQSWMSRCQDGTVVAKDVGVFFSCSEEHQALVKKSCNCVFLPTLRSEPTRSWERTCSTPAPNTAETAPALEDPTGGEGENGAAVAVQEVEESPPDNDIAVESPTLAVLEQVVELSIFLSGEMYDDELDDPASLQYQTLSRQLAEKIEDGLEGLPGFKSVSVLDFRPQKDTHGRDGVGVDYAVTVVVVDGAGVSYEQLSYLSLQSNRVESSYHGVTEPTGVHTVSGVKDLRNDELEAVSEAPEAVSTANRTSLKDTELVILEKDTEDVVLGDILPEVSEPNTAATEEHNIVPEESAVVSPAPVPSPGVPGVSSFEEESLFLKGKVQTPIVEAPPPEDHPVELPDGVTLPEPPVEVEASGSDINVLEDPLQPSTPTGAASFEETGLEDVTINPDETAELKAAGGEPITAAKEAEIPDVIEILATAHETTGEEHPPARVPTPEVVDVAPAASVPATQTDMLPVDEDLAEESNFREAPLTDEDVNVEEVGVEEGSETLPEAPAVEEESPDAPKLSTEDLTEDEILGVNDEEPTATGFLSPPQPTAPSPERESAATQISDIYPTEAQPDVVIPSLVEIQTINGSAVPGRSDDVTNHTEEGSTSFPFGVAHDTDRASVAMPMNPGRALMVFFSLRVTNMIFSEDLFNKSSPEYKALEQRFLELLVPYLQSNLSNFENLEILNFRNGSIVVNSRMKFGKPVQQGVTSTVYLILEDFCNTAYQTMNLAIDKYSLDVESGDQADPCKFQACNEYAECKVNKWSGEAECVCGAGYFSVDGLPCQSICELQTDFCLNDGKCDIIPGRGAICRCRVGENWWYRGEHCEEYVSEPLVVGIAVASVAGFLLVASGVIFFLARTLREQYDKDEYEDPIRGAESLPSLERATKYNPMYESEATTGYSHYYRRYPEAPVYSSASAEASTDFSSEEMRHIYDNSELTKEEIQDRIRIVELYAKDRQFADFVRQHQAVMGTRGESSSM
ncbi:interphotoreceptor matrix proteoglycan 2-like [Brachionichthys hirsutus]|uniref:interphotoreceptor matrix proteoglycan 2-like n=1 Tax=Brachionichthys hirsutus TaxID=412623 RepID=UPI00360535DE